MLDQVIADGLLAADRPVVVMLSGGRDSTCLLDLAVRIAGARVVTAVHANYGLRGAADADERHCAELCEQLGVQLDVRRPVRAGGAAAPPAKPGASPVQPETENNLQAWARKERYRAAADLAVARDADVAVGHTRSDQVETILYRLASSPSRRALLGMRTRDGALIRPLLRFTREEVSEYCTGRGLRWRDDESNESSAYARNRIRRDLVPALERIHPAAQDNVLAVAEILRDEADVLDEVVAAALQGRDEIELAALRELAPAVQRLVIQRLADAAAGGPAAGAARRAAEVAALSEHGTASLDLPHGVRATVTSGVLRFGPTPALGTDRGHQPGVREDAP
jgi:tRNA(Ile)-lysidine synthase